MDLGSWQNTGTDVVRLKRLAAGYATGVVIMGGSLAFVAATAASAYGFDEEQIIEAAIVDGPEDEPHVEEQPEPEKKEEVKPKPRLQAIEAPTTVDTKLTEKEPVASDNPYGGEDPYALLESAATAAEVPKAAVVEAPKIIEKPKVVAAPKAAEPLRVTEDMTPPKALSNPAPSYPPEAKAAGIEGTVVIRYVVTETGDVTDVKAVKGPPELQEVCVAMVKTWKFSPALDKDGKPVRYPRVTRIPFKIKT
jgi:protein TonB